MARPCEKFSPAMAPCTGLRAVCFPDHSLRGRRVAVVARIETEATSGNQQNYTTLTVKTSIKKSKSFGGYAVFRLLIASQNFEATLSRGDREVAGPNTRRVARMNAAGGASREFVTAICRCRRRSGLRLQMLAPSKSQLRGSH